MVNRYVSRFDTEKLNREFVDVVIVGAGIAGLFTALMLPKDLKILVLSKDSYQNSNSYKAQGGIACVMDEVKDHLQKHFVDTMVCGKNACDVEALKVLINESQQNVDRLIECGVAFDKDQEGKFLLGKEGAHSAHRILHVNDHTGKSIMDALYMKVLSEEHIVLKEKAFVVDLLTRGQKCYGLIYEEEGEKKVCYAGKTVLATGGIGKLFGKTTNADVATGDGIGMAVRAGVKLKHMSYVQYHPTVFYDVKNQKEVFLITEALRGEGAIIRNHQGEAIMEKVHPLKDLAPRDIVSYEMMKVMKKEKKPYVFLDGTMHSKESLIQRFPSIYKECLENGYDMSKEVIPIAPMMHYFMGGISVGVHGQTNFEDLYACGECAHTGVHGKNRLASNSLLEAIVFSNRIVRHVTKVKSFQKGSQHEISEKNEVDCQVDAKCVKLLGEKLDEYFNTLQNVRQSFELEQLRTNLTIQQSSVQSLLDIEEINKVYTMSEIIKDLVKEEQKYANETANG